jgi:xanthine dehydrogenase molybdopterin-binding subunit B
LKHYLIMRAAAQVTGEAVYTDDLPHTPNLLHAALVKSARPHARILALDPGPVLQVRARSRARFCVSVRAVAPPWKRPLRALWPGGRAPA